MTEAALNEECLSCFEKIDKDSVILPCGHAFCYDCLIESYKAKLCHYSSIANNRICPYCRTPCPYLPLRNGYIPLKGIHREYVSKSVHKLMAAKCKGIYKSGPKKGKPCCAKAKLNSDYCGRHKSQEQLTSET